MGEGQLLVAAAALICRRALVLCLGLQSVAAQGPVYREQWAYMHLENRRLEVLRELAGRDEDTVGKVAQICAEPDAGVQFASMAKALAILRQVPGNDSFLLRSAVGAFVLPEVCDPDAEKEVCRSLNVSVFLPVTLPLPDALEFELVAKDAAGGVVWTKRIDRDTTLSDLRMARATASMPADVLLDGRYTMTIATVIDGKLPAATDPVLAWPFHVLRGYQARSEAALTSAREMGDKLEGTTKALFDGFVHGVGRAYTGEAFVVASDGVRDLERLEQALRNVAANEPVLASLTGDIPTELPGTNGVPMQCVLRLQPGPAARPLVVFVTSTPTYDLTSRRPTAPATRHPGWAANELAGFAASRQWNVAFLESPGAGRDHFAALGSALTALTSMLPKCEQKPFLVCDREAAAVIAFQFAAIQSQVCGLVLVGAGAAPGPMLQALGRLPVRYAQLHGHPSSSGVQRVFDYVAHQRSEGSWSGDVAPLTTRTLPWPFGVPLLATEIETFAAACFSR